MNRLAPDLIVLDPVDNVASALRDLEPGAAVVADTAGRRRPLSLAGPIRLGHKAATEPIDRGALVVKHGQPIGRATAAIGAGDHVHVHNVRGLSWETDTAIGPAPAEGR